ncbi:MAG: iron chelate uptake ABC transporter family permease subunit, partial [Burkholderiales bacterium]
MTGVSESVDTVAQAKAKRAWIYAFPLIALLSLILLAFSVGRFPVSPSELLTILLTKLSGTSSELPSTAETVIFQIRGPRVIAAIVVGAALAAAGAAYQGMFRNPLVSPDILGVS